MSRPKSRHPKTRITLEVATEVRDLIESLKDRIGADSATEVIRRAVALYDDLLRRVEGGGKVVTRGGEDGDHVLLEGPR